MGGAAPSPRSAAPEPTAPDDGDGAPHWDERPIALADGDAGPGRRLRAVSAAAGRVGVRAGMTVAAARARCAGLEVWPWDDGAVTHAVLEVTAALLVASPQVTPVAGAPGLWWVGAMGLDGVGGERGIVRALARLAAAWHPRPRVGVADSCVAARAATWDLAGSRETGIVVVPRGGCAAYLAGVPLDLVPMDDELRAGLRALGIRVAGGLASLDAGDVERRWGATGLMAWRLTRGDDARRPVLARAEARRSVSAELAVPAATLEPVLFLVRAALDRLAEELQRDGLGAAVLALTLALDDRTAHTVTREVRLARPLARAAPLFERCRALLERVTPAAPICGVTVTVAATGRLTGEQGDLLSPAWHDPSAAEAAFARIRAELGPNVVVRAEARDGHRPERAGAWVPVERVDESPRPDDALPPPDVHVVADDATAPDAAAADLPAGALAVALPSGWEAALRLLERAEAARVLADDDGAPGTVWWRDRRLAVRRADGPERLSGEWWSEPYRRDYWRCDTDAGALLVYLDRLGGAEWRVQGWYD